MKEEQLIGCKMFGGTDQEAWRKNLHCLSGTCSVHTKQRKSNEPPRNKDVQWLWSEWMISGEGKLTKGGNLKRPEIDLVAQWVKDAWDSIPAEMVQKSFRKSCISNALDGTEDDEAFTDDK